jgi:hypothetical protein
MPHSPAPPNADPPKKQPAVAAGTASHIMTPRNKTRIVAREMYALTDGWVAGRQFFATHLNSVRARLCSSLCVALVGDAQPSTAVITLLARLETDNLFIAQVERVGNETWYRLNPLFRESLLHRFRERSQARQHEIHHAAWCWFRDHDLPDDAVLHALQAGEASAAADLVLKVARGLQVAGDLRKLQKMTDEQWYAILDCYMTAPFRILRAAYPHIKALHVADVAENRAVYRKIVNILSVSALNGNAGQMNYSSAKAGATVRIDGRGPSH